MRRALLGTISAGLVLILGVAWPGNQAAADEPTVFPDIQRILDAGDEWHGSTVHFVTEELDGGPVIVQVRVPVLPGDDAERLAARVLKQEHRLYPQAIRWLAQGRVSLNGEQLLFDQQPLQQPLQINAVE